MLKCTTKISKIKFITISMFLDMLHNDSVMKEMRILVVQFFLSGAKPAGEVIYGLYIYIYIDIYKKVLCGMSHTPYLTH